MTWWKAMFAGWVGVGLCTAAPAGLPAHSKTDYQDIIARNVFNLTPEPPPPGPPAPPLPEITLTGITTIFSDKRALLKIHYPPGPAGLTKEEEWILKLGERVGAVEVLAIDEKAGWVEVSNNGTIMTITFPPPGQEHHAAAATAASRPIIRRPLRFAVH
jgi:hypothetical protein